MASRSGSRELCQIHQASKTPPGEPLSASRQPSHTEGDVRLRAMTVDFAECLDLVQHVLHLTVDVVRHEEVENKGHAAPILVVSNNQLLGVAPRSSPLWTLNQVADLQAAKHSGLMVWG